MLQGVTGVCGRKEDEFDVSLTLVILFKVWVLGLFWWAWDMAGGSGLEG